MTFLSFFSLEKKEWRSRVFICYVQAKKKMRFTTKTPDKRENRNGTKNDSIFDTSTFNQARNLLNQKPHDTTITTKTVYNAQAVCSSIRLWFDKNVFGFWFLVAMRSIKLNVQLVVNSSCHVDILISISKTS